MKTIHDIRQMRQTAENLRAQGNTIAFVPTMGYLHEGHLSLMRKGRELADILVASIFVNPAQFAPGEDYEAYPRDPERDAALAEQTGVDILFTSQKNDLYPEGYETYITQTHLPGHLCGQSRPTHFTGVMTIVAKLFHIADPNYAIFGQKDYQQLAIIRKMTRDLDFNIEIVGGPIVRESDGLAMSSRNKYLSPSQRQSALQLYRSLQEVQKLVDSGETKAAVLIETAGNIIAAAPETDIDYIAVCDPDTLADKKIIDRPALMALAVRVGQTRLIDNTILYPQVDNAG
ncbi:MAG: pantoate--beta-alanine ligase [Desulfobacterales bacterium]|nr:pantoate--beta-alanine ligase [Desulfobacterales bacterium]